MLILVFFEVRRGDENLDALKKEHFKIIEDENYQFKYIKKILCEKDKNHKLEGTNVESCGVIPFLVIDNKFNPGQYLQFYLSLIPDQSTMTKVEGGYLFPRPRLVCKKFDLHRRNENYLYECNQKVGKTLVQNMLPELCKAVESPRATNHSLRATAIKSMHRFGIPWLTIAKITGHKDVNNLILAYDLTIEAPGMVDIVGALAQGPSLAQGQAPIKIEVKSRNKREVNIVLEGNEPTPVKHNLCSIQTRKRNLCSHSQTSKKIRLDSKEDQSKTIDQVYINENKLEEKICVVESIVVKNSVEVCTKEEDSNFSEANFDIELPPPEQYMQQPPPEQFMQQPPPEPFMQQPFVMQPPFFIPQNQFPMGNIYQSGATYNITYNISNITSKENK